tara:strand:+ start:29 stop:172 length:144 start_codon:yes stop_codon:yes gene_type:complete
MYGVIVVISSSLKEMPEISNADLIFKGFSILLSTNRKEGIRTIMTPK